MFITVVSSESTSLFSELIQLLAAYTLLLYVPNTVMYVLNMIP